MKEYIIIEKKYPNTMKSIYAKDRVEAITIANTQDDISIFERDGDQWLCTYGQYNLPTT